MAVLALAICILGIGGLRFLDRDKGVRTSRALWLAVVWLWIVGSRAPSSWLGIGGGANVPGQALDATLEGNSTDAVIYVALVAFGVVVLLRRKMGTGPLLKASTPVLLYFGYCLISVLWSPFPEVAFRRWIKAAGDLVIVLIVATDAQPVAALRRLYSRVGAVIMPFSIYLIRYSSLGRGYDPDGNAANTGVTTNKNTLGLITFVLALGALWNVRALIRNQYQANRGRRLLAQSILLGLGVVVLGMARSATSTACFIIGSGLMLVTGLPAIRRNSVRLHATVFAIALAAGFAMIFGADEMAVHALGRTEGLTGRTDIWKTVIPLARHPIIGEGFQSFWNSYSPILRNLPQQYMFAGLNSAHNGYIEVYLNLGWIGVSLIAAMLISGYRLAASAFRYDADVGSLVVACIATVGIYSITEAGFRMMTPTWIFLLMAIVFAGGISGGHVKVAPKLNTSVRSPKNASRTARYWAVPSKLSRS